jgi:predicted enzyme related to lactoylglutathione lyase
MADGATSRKNRPAWVDLASSDPAASRDFYSKLFGWNVEVSEDPQYGGYGIAHLPDGGEDVAGIGPKMGEEAPTAWNLYIGTDDADALTAKVAAAGGMVIAPAFDVGDMGRMAVFADAAGAVISCWQTGGEGSFRTGEVGTFGWAELNARGIDKAKAFYADVFGWTSTTTPMEGDLPDYTQFELNGEGILGGMEMQPTMPAEVPSYWMPYFNVADVDVAYRRALEIGASEMVAPTPMPGGRFAIVSDPQGAMFGMLKMDQAA